MAYSILSPDESEMLIGDIKSACEPAFRAERSECPEAAAVSAAVQFS